MKESATLSTASPSARRSWYSSATVWLFLAAFLVRIIFMLVLGTYHLDQRDERSYVNVETSIARSLAEGHGFSSPFSEIYTGPTAWVGPLYPYFVAPVFRCFGVMSYKSFVVIQTVQSLFSALTVWPLVGILSLCGSRRAGICAAVVWAFFPWFSRWALTAISETSLSALLLTFLLWFALWMADNRSHRGWIAFGALWGVTLLINPALATLLPVTLAFALSPVLRGGRSWIRPAITVLGVCFLVVSPWIIRNRVVMGEWVFIRDNFGFEFALGNYHLSFGRGWAGKHPDFNPREFDLYRTQGELGYIQEKTSQAVRFVGQYPVEFLELCARRVMYFWDGSALRYRGPMAAYWLPWSFGMFSFLLLPTLPVCRYLQLRAWWMFLAVVLIFPIPCYLTHPLMPYRHIIEPIMVLLISFAVVESFASIPAASPLKAQAASA